MTWMGLPVLLADVETDDNGDIWLVLLSPFGMPIRTLHIDGIGATL